MTSALALIYKYIDFLISIADISWKTGGKSCEGVKMIFELILKIIFNFKNGWFWFNINSPTP